MNPLGYAFRTSLEKTIPFIISFAEALEQRGLRRNVGIGMSALGMSALGMSARGMSALGLGSVDTENVGTGTGNVGTGNVGTENTHCVFCLLGPRIWHAHLISLHGRNPKLADQQYIQ